MGLLQTRRLRRRGISARQEGFEHGPRPEVTDHGPPVLSRGIEMPDTLPGPFEYPLGPLFDIVDEDVRDPLGGGGLSGCPS